MKIEKFQLSRYSGLVAMLLLAIFTTYFVNVTLFPHSHIVDGVTIVHSHFSTQEHQNNATSEDHTRSELTLISSLSNFIAEIQSSIEVPKIITTEYHSILGDLEEIISNPVSYRLPQLRAPPSKIYIG